METLKFKTNINCGGCIAAVTPSLNALPGVKDWKVDTANRDKVLSVEAEAGLSANEIIAALKSKGFQAQLV